MASWMGHHLKKYPYENENSVSVSKKTSTWPDFQIFQISKFQLVTEPTIITQLRLELKKWSHDHDDRNYEKNLIETSGLISDTRSSSQSTTFPWFWARDWSSLAASTCPSLFILAV